MSAFGMAPLRREAGGDKSQNRNTGYAPRRAGAAKRGRPKPQGEVTLGPGAAAQHCRRQCCKGVAHQSPDRREVRKLARANG
eukprot:9172584-Heterocapsa_arctica.AAC.2